MGKVWGIKPQTKAKSGRNQVIGQREGHKDDAELLNYLEYHFTLRERVKLLAEYLAISGGFAYLFYRSFIVFGILLCFYPLYRNRVKAKYVLRRQQILCKEFKDGIQSVAAALGAGYSIENAFREAYVDMNMQYGSGSYMTEELRYMNSRISVNVPLEELLQDFSNRSGVEDVQSFCEIFIFAKRSGGDFIQIIHMTANRIAEKTDLMEEIQTEIAGKKMEQRIMNCMPLFILVYVDVSFGDYLDSMYHNLTGFLVMSACLAVYLGAYLLSERIINIQV